jgi:formylglycine-generating enzyme required for sulfatase activity
MAGLSLGRPVLRGRIHKHPRVLRGGAFNNNARNLRCAYRNNNDPDNRNNNIGFRVVLSTFFGRQKCPAG